MISGIFSLTIALTVTAFAVPASAQDDHLQCFKIRDPIRLKGLVDLDSPQLGLDEDCKIRKAKFFCVPVTKTVTEVQDGGDPLTPLPFSGAPAPGDRICYTVRCPKDELPDQFVTDQFGQRTLEKLKAQLVCTPAVKGTSFCGDGTIDAGEDCEPGDLGGSTCETLGFVSGALACAAGCAFDTSGCVSSPPDTCGNATVDGNESCDGADLGGQDCTTFGFTESAGLACTSECRLDLSGCETSSEPTARFARVGGRFQDNGNGTTTDTASGLTWQVKTGTFGSSVFCPDVATCPDPHDVNNRYTWSDTATAFDGGARTAFLDVLNDVAGGGVSCFAGHCDWRLASLPELKGILLEPEAGGSCGVSPCIDASFPGPTASSLYWSSTTNSANPLVAWVVSFDDGHVTADGKDSDLSVRAVRGGL